MSSPPTFREPSMFNDSNWQLIVQYLAYIFLMPPWSFWLWTGWFSRLSGAFSRSTRSQVFLVRPYMSWGTFWRAGCSV